MPIPACPIVGVEIGLVRDDVAEDVRLDLNLFSEKIDDRLATYLVESVGGFRNEHTEKDVFVGAESVDDQAHQPLHVGIECGGLGHGPTLQSRCGDSMPTTLGAPK